MDAVSIIVMLGVSTVFALICVGYGISLRIWCLTAGGVTMFLTCVASALGEKVLGGVLGLASIILFGLAPIELWLKERRRLYT